MTKRFPNTETRKTVADELKKAYGRSWRRRGEVLFDVKPGGLRRLVDRKLTDGEAETIEAKIAEMHSRRIACCRNSLAPAEGDADAFEGLRQRREKERLDAALENDPEYWAVFDAIARMSGIPGGWPRNNRID